MHNWGSGHPIQSSRTAKFLTRDLLVLVILFFAVSTVAPHHWVALGSHGCSRFWHAHHLFGYAVGLALQWIVHCANFQLRLYRPRERRGGRVLAHVARSLFATTKQGHIAKAEGNRTDVGSGCCFVMGRVGRNRKRRISLARLFCGTLLWHDNMGGHVHSKCCDIGRTLARSYRYYQN
jgi:hypothetical protein